MKVRVFCGNKLAKAWECDVYEEINECGYDNLYVEKDGMRHKACTLGDFGYGYWNYDVER